MKNEEGPFQEKKNMWKETIIKYIIHTLFN